MNYPPRPGLEARSQVYRGGSSPESPIGGWWLPRQMPEGAEPRSYAELAPNTEPPGTLGPGVFSARPTEPPTGPGYAPGLGRPPQLGPHLDGSLQLRLLVAEPQHPDDGQGHTEPVEEAEEIDDGEDIGGEGVQQGHDALKAETGSVSPRSAWAGAGNGAAGQRRPPRCQDMSAGGLQHVCTPTLKEDPV